MAVFNVTEKIHEKQMSELADKTGLTFDGGDDNRLFADDEKRIDVYAKTMTEKEYEQMEKEIDDYKIEREKYNVYVGNDCSGYDYWNKEGEINYIQITVHVKDKNLSQKEIEQLIEDVERTYSEFDQYDNVEDYIEYLEKQS